jgi:perosamine synthetase
MIKTLTEEIIQGVRDVVQTEEVLQLHEPDLDESDALAVADCVRSGWVSSVGEYVNKFEKEISNFTGAPYVVASSTGTSALQVALRVVGVSAGDEVLVPALSFIATANAVSYLGAHPHFVDVSESNFGIDAKALSRHLRNIVQASANGPINKLTGRAIRACVPMHCFGHPADIQEIKNVCDEFGIDIVEDAAEALGSLLNGKHVGNHGKVGALSFNGNKIITTGGGGALLFTDEELAKKAKHLTTTAKKPHAWKFEHDEIGYNFRLPNLNAALGVSQMKRLPNLLKQKRALAKKYSLRFKDNKNFRFVEGREGTEPNFWLNTLVLPFSSIQERDECLGVLHRAKIMARPAWNLLNDLTMYKNSPRSTLTVAENLERTIINIPSSAKLERP